MKIRLFAVSPLVHYAPLFLALKRLKDESNYDVEFVATEYDEKTITQIIEEDEHEQVTNLFITSIQDLDHRIELIREDGIAIDHFYDDYIIWRTLIDRVPITIFALKDHDQNAFRKIACYPEGSTVDYFIRENYAGKDRNLEFFEVSFGTDEEFEKVSNKQVDCAVTLEPWKIKKRKFAKTSGIPSKPFGFTSILAHSSTVTEDTKRELVKQVIEFTNKEIEDLYAKFDSDYLKKEDNLIQKEILFNRVREAIGDLGDRIFGKNEVEESLKWMVENRIWSIDAVNPLSSSNKLRSAYQKIEEISKRKSLENFTLLSIHQLKNDLRHKIEEPLKGTLSSLKSEKALQSIEEVVSFTNKVVIQYDNFIKACKALTSDVISRESGSTKLASKDSWIYDIRDVVEDIKEVHGVDYIHLICDVDDLKKITVDREILRFMINGLIENAIEYYDAEFNPEQKITITISEEKIYNRVVIKVFNTGSFMEERMLETIGINPVESGLTNSGSFLKFLNHSLDMLNAEKLDRSSGRVFAVENVDKPQGFQVSMGFKLKEE